MDKFCDSKYIYLYICIADVIHRILENIMKQYDCCKLCEKLASCNKYTLLYILYIYVYKLLLWMIISKQKYTYSFFNYTSWNNRLRFPNIARNKSSTIQNGFTSSCFSQHVPTFRPFKLKYVSLHPSYIQAPHENNILIPCACLILSQFTTALHVSR